MDDSSQNPYIPQESEQIRQKVYERQSPLGRFVKWSLIATLILAMLVAAGLFFVIPRTTAVDQPARVKLADALQPPDQTQKRVQVDSDAGFKLSYDNRVYSSYAEVGDGTSGTDGSAAVIAGATYENNDLRVTRAYNYVRISPIESVESSRSLATLPPQLELFATVTDKDLVTAAANAENKGLSKLSLFVKLDGDKRQAKKVADDNTVVTIDASKPVSTKIGDTDYQKVRYTTTNDNYRVSNIKYDDCYYTIQNTQPYSVCVTGVRPTNVSAASLVEQVFDSISYQQPATVESTGDTTTSKTTSYSLPTIKLAQATSKDTSESATTESTVEDATESPLLTVKPSYYTDPNSLMAIAKNQPSVARIGTLYCADLALKGEDGEAITTLTDACAGTVATGVFVSKDGYLATTGHAIRAQPKAAINGYINFATDQGQVLERLQRVLDYLLKAGLIMDSDAEYLKNGAKTGDQEALAKIENIGSVIPDKFITPVKEEYSYAVQPGEKPIVINRTDSNKPTFAYSDSVLSAKYVPSDYSVAKPAQSTFGDVVTKTDIGLLKVDGDFQYVTLAKNSEVKADDTLATVGYTAYTDSSLTVDKIRNIPVATVSKVEQAYTKNETQLIQTNTPILPGNDGAPVFNSRGELVGFAVYGLTYCPDQQCFANGTVRSVAELQKLTDKENITFAAQSNASKAWHSGVDQYFAANYAASADSFATAGSDYAFNRWADPLNKLAVDYKGSSSDTSFMNQLQTVMIAALGALVVATGVLAVLHLLRKRRISQLQVGLYGTTEAQPSLATPQVPQQAESVSLPPVKQSYPTQSLPTQSSQPLPAVPTQPVQPYEQPGVGQPIQPPVQPQNAQQPEDPFYK